MKLLNVSILLLILSVPLFIFPQSTKIAPNPTKEWPRSSPAEQQLDTEKLNEVIRLINEDDELPDVHSLLIVRNGYLVVEEYFGDHNAETIHTLQSVSKSFASALIGIAIEQGKIKSVDEKIVGFFPEFKNILNLDERKKAIRIKDLLTMRSGTDYHERDSGSPHHQLNALARGWDRFYLNRPMINNPGEYYQYDSGGVILLSSILKKQIGMHADKFADKYLFPALNIKETKWFRNEEDHPHTGGGMHLLPRDMAKFGLLYLREGVWENKQLIPKKWIEQSFKMHVEFGEKARGKDVGYGYLWWILQPDPTGNAKAYIYAAEGFMAQYIFVIPEHDMVVVYTGGARSGFAHRQPINYLYSHILKSVKK